MGFGSEWRGLGNMHQPIAFEMLDYFYDQGGNFIDTGIFQDGESEKWIGQWLQKNTGRRNKVVISTKYTGFYRNKGEIHAEFSRKSLQASVDTSLERLNTNYIDLLYIHYWDGTTHSVEEVMPALNQLVTSGKVLYLGIADTPAWVVAKANQYAKANGLATFVVYQGEWSLQARDMEKEILPMCKAEGLGVVPWGVLGGGQFKTAEEKKLKVNDNSRRESALKQATSQEMVLIVLEVAAAKAENVIPCIGCRTLTQLESAVEALAVTLNADEIKELEVANPIEFGYPHSILERIIRDNSDSDSKKY